MPGTTSRVVEKVLTVQAVAAFAAFHDDLDHFEGLVIQKELQGVERLLCACVEVDVGAVAAGTSARPIHSRRKSSSQMVKILRSMPSSFIVSVSSM